MRITLSKLAKAKLKGVGLAEQDAFNAFFFADEIKRKGDGHLIIKKTKGRVIHLRTRTKDDAITITDVILI